MFKSLDEVLQEARNTEFHEGTRRAFFDYYSRQISRATTDQWKKDSAMEILRSIFNVPAPVSHVRETSFWLDD